jgi:hypothetical protein
MPDKAREDAAAAFQRAIANGDANEYQSFENGYLAARRELEEAPRTLDPQEWAQVQAGLVRKDVLDERLACAAICGELATYETGERQRAGTDLMQRIVGRSLGDTAPPYPASQRELYSPRHLTPQDLGGAA